MAHGVPAIAQILVVFALVVAATAFKAHIGVAAALGGLLLALWRGMGFREIWNAVTADVLNADTLLLLALMASIMVFSSAMKKSGAMQKLVATLADISPSPRVAMALAPLLIGTLPMPGGAVLSAPLVDAMDPGRSLGSGKLSAANYWFRHNLELAWPLYPAFILTTSIAGVSVLKLMALNFYAAPLLFALGLAFVLPARSGGEKGPRRAAKAGNSAARPRPRKSVGGMVPLALVLGIYIVLSILWSLISPHVSLPEQTSGIISRYLPAMAGLAAGGIFLASGPGGAAVFRGSFTLAVLKLLGVILGIKVFAALTGAAGIAEKAAAELTGAGIPAIAAVAIIPFIAGLVTGVGFGYVGLAFPIVFGLIPAGGPFSREATIVLAGAFGYAGMMLSPLHVCMVVSAQHFKAKLPDTIRRSAAPLGIFVLVAVIYASLLAVALHG